MEFGAVQRGFLGVVIRDMDQATARRRSIGVRQGAYITELTPNGVGAQAGLQVGDVIVALNNRPVRNASELQEQVANYRPGQDVTLRLMRGTAELNLAVTLRNRQGTTGLAQRKPMGNPTNPDALRQLGGTFAELTAQQLSEHQAAHGVLLRSTDTGSPLARAGVPTGFVLVRVNHQPIRTVADLRRVLGTSTGQVLLEGIKPNGHAAWYVLNLP
jgi:S1-C subfamily serine protease